VGRLDESVVPFEGVRLGREDLEHCHQHFSSLL
jgi:hypothetical protein